jgi:hypothetical protein
MTDLFEYINPKTGNAAPMVSEFTYAIIMKHKEKLDAHVIQDRDNNFNFFGFKTLCRSYLLKINGEIAERPQHMYMRVAVGIHGEDVDSVIETYDMLSQGLFSHASPTMFNAGTPRNQLSSCFLLQMKEDSIEGIYDTLKTCAMISKTAGGIGLSIHNIRASGSYIAGTNGNSNGLVPMLRVFNNTARYDPRHPPPFLSLSCAWLLRRESTPPSCGWEPLEVSLERLTACHQTPSWISGTSTRVATSDRVHSRCTSSRGTPTSSTSSTFARTLGWKRPELAICSTHCGSLTCSWSEWRATASGR